VGRLYSTFWSNLSKNFNFGGSYTLVVAPMGVKFGMEEGTFGRLLHAKFHLHRCNVSPVRGGKPQNRPLSKRNTGRFALRAMLPVIIDVVIQKIKRVAFSETRCRRQSTFSGYRESSVESRKC